MKRFLRLAWARVRCNAFILRHLFHDPGYVEYTLSCRGRITHVIAVIPGFLVIDQVGDNISVHIDKTKVVKVFFEEEP